jgi:hypothetical protein
VTPITWNNWKHAIFQSLSATNMKMLLPCSHVEGFRSFRCAFCIHFHDYPPWWWRQ